MANAPILTASPCGSSAAPAGVRQLTSATAAPSRTAGRRGHGSAPRRAVLTLLCLTALAALADGAGSGSAAPAKKPAAKAD